MGWLSGDFKFKTDDKSSHLKNFLKQALVKIRPI